MLTSPSRVATQLPKNWPRRVRSALVHAISMSNVVFAVTRSHAENHFSTRVRLRAENDRLRREVALLGGSIPPQGSVARSIGEVFDAPIDVILTPHDILQPDIVVVTDGAHITTRGIEGAPWLVVEILSPSTRWRPSPAPRRGGSPVQHQVKLS